MTVPRVLREPLHAVRAARHRWLLHRWLCNAEEVWRAYQGGLALPTLRLRSGLSLAHGPDDAPVFLLFEILANGCYRSALRDARGGTIVDIGANIGVFTLQALGRSDVSVHAYEPHPRTAATLRRNVAANDRDGRVTVFEEAVGQARGSCRLSADGPSLTSSLYAEPGASGVIVSCVGLDEVVERAGGAVSLIKIDAEGAEVDILTGASPEVLREIPALVLECHDWLVVDATARAADVLRGAGFRVGVRAHGRATLLSANR